MTPSSSPSEPHGRPPPRPKHLRCPHDLSGERRLAERLQQKLDGDYLLWFDVPIGPKQCHPDFVVLHPRRGLLILQTKD